MVRDAPSALLTMRPDKDRGVPHTRRHARAALKCSFRFTDPSYAPPTPSTQFDYGVSALTPGGMMRHFPLCNGTSR